jgi:hypothetical protein
VAIIGRIRARQRLRKAARESLRFPAFSSPIDCTPWVLGGLWPAELSTITAETATLAADLKDDLERITKSTNDQLTIIKRAGLADHARQAQEARLIDEARARAARRVESTIGYLHAMNTHAPAKQPRPQVAQRLVAQDHHTTQVLPAVTATQPAVKEPTATSPQPQQPTKTPHNEAPVAGPLTGDDEPEVWTAQHQGWADQRADHAVTTPDSRAASHLPAPQTAANTEHRRKHLQRLLAFVVPQAPRLTWAVGDQPDGTTVVVSDLAHGWIPPGITLPAGVRLLEPQRRPGIISALLSDATMTATYTPGDPVDHFADIAATQPSVQPRALPVLNDLGWELGRVTHWRDGLPRIVHTLATATAARTGVLEEEAELLRRHLDTARYQLLIQYPDVDPALLLNCLLLAATEAFVAQDCISANYHLAWFHKLNQPPSSQ